MKSLLQTLTAALLLTIAWLPSSFADELIPRQVVATTVQSIIDILQQREDKDRLTEDDRQAIRGVLATRFDFVAMTRGSIGRPWRQLDQEKRQAFVAIFTQLMEYTYGNRLSSYHGQVIKYHKAEFKKKRARVKSEVIDGDKITPVEYRLRQRKTGWKIYDIKIEGVSMVGTFRKDFRGMIDHHGLDGLYDALKKKVQILIERSRK
ncbi:MAG: ABC transporter substrate-binding protein [Mariprofundales bacterium]